MEQDISVNIMENIPKTKIESFNNTTKLLPPSQENKINENSLKNKDTLQLVQLWQKSKNPQIGQELINRLNPVIEGAMQNFAGYKDPMLKSKAKIIIMKVLDKYKPESGKFENFIYSHLQGLNRYARQQEQIISVPERVHLDKYTLDETVRELRHELGREPTDQEICERTGFSPKRLAYIRKYNQPLAEGSILARNPTLENSVYGQNITTNPQLDRLWVKVVYDELDPYHQAVMEYTLGLNGKPQLSNLEIAKRLNRTPGAISQAKKRIETKLRQGQYFEDILGQFS